MIPCGLQSNGPLLIRTSTDCRPGFWTRGRSRTCKRVASRETAGLVVYDVSLDHSDQFAPSVRFALSRQTRWFAGLDGVSRTRATAMRVMWDALLSVGQPAPQTRAPLATCQRHTPCIGRTRGGRLANNPCPFEAGSVAPAPSRMAVDVV